MKTLISILLLLTVSLAYAQPRVVTFGDENEKDDSSSELEMNNIKISLFELASGDFPIYYERVLTEKLSIEGGLGVTFGDYLGSIFLDSYSTPFETGVNSKYGYSLSLGARFYPFQVFEDLYIAAEYKFRKYNWEREVITYDENTFEETSAIYKESRTYSLPRIVIGYSFFYDYNLTMDYHIGIGMNTPTENYYDSYEKEVIVNDYNTRPRLHIGLKIGYAF